MSVSHGADVEALRVSSRELADVAHALFNANLAITARVWDFSWNGADATRFRGQWEAEHSPQVGRICAALNEAASAIAEHAADQDRASSATGQTSTATGDLQHRLTTQRDVLMWLSDAAQVGRAMAAHPEAWRSLETFNRAWDLGGTFASNLERYGGGALGVLGTVIGAHGLVKGASEGDTAAVVQSAVPLGVTALASRGLMASGTGAAVSVSWGAGTMIGNHINEQMEGTRYGDRVTENFEAVFDAYGPAGMLLTPAVLIKSGLDMIGDDETHEPPIP